MDVFFGKPLITSFKKVMKNAKEELIIISPYIRIMDEYSDLVREKKGNALNVVIIHSDNRVGNSVSLLQHFDKPGIRLKVFYLENLHAKVYINEKYALMTSKNLTEKNDSIHNEEIGILFKADEKPYDRMMRYYHRLASKAQLKYQRD